MSEQTGCAKCTMHGYLEADYKEFKAAIVKDQEKYHAIGDAAVIVERDLGILKQRVQENEDECKPLLPQVKIIIGKYYDDKDELYKHISKIRDSSIIEKESLKAIHQRMDINDVQRITLEKKIDGIRLEIKTHIKEEELTMNETKGTVLKVGLFLIAYLISFAVYVYNVGTQNDKDISLIKQDVTYIKDSIKSFKNNKNVYISHLGKD